jgi:hypothetical protein
MLEKNQLRRILLIFLTAFFLHLPAGLAQTGRAVWAIGDSEKIERDDLHSLFKRGNAVWNGRRIRLFGARNEIIAFQLIVEAGATEIKQLSVVLPELKCGTHRIAYRAPGNDPSNAVGRPIQLFTVNYLNVTQTTAARWFYWSKNALPPDTTGWKPVQLVPENAKAGRGGFPVRVASQQNQAIWIEIYTARELPAGIYRGQVQVMMDRQTKRIPIELELFDFTLPDENSLPTMVYYEGSQPELYQGRNLDAEYHRFAHRHRVELTHGYSIEMVKAAMGRFTGADFTKAKGYEGPGEGIGNQIVPATFYGPGKDFDERANAWRKADEWMIFLNQHLPKARTFLYMPDEPPPSQYPYIRQIADNIHSNPGPGRALPIMVTKRYVKELDGAIDIWNGGMDFKEVAAERAKGRQYWTYGGGRPASGANLIDTPATDVRMLPWACFKAGVSVYFQWHSVHWRHNGQKQGERNQNVWANPVTFDNRGQPNKPIEDQNFANGDGVQMYPGEDKLHPDQDRGIAGPIGTVQLANLRRGLQDHLYLTMARQRGHSALVDELIKTLIPRVHSEVQETDPIGFAERGDDYEQARYRLAQAIAAKKRP